MNDEPACRLGLVMPPVQVSGEQGEAEHDCADRELAVALPETGQLVAAEFFVDLSQECFVGFRRDGQGRLQIHK